MHSTCGMAARPSGRRLCVAIDLTRVEPHGVPDTLPIRFSDALICHAPEVNFVVLTRPTLSNAFDQLEAHNSRRVVVAEPSPLQLLLRRVDARLPARSRRARLAREHGWPRPVRVAAARLWPTLLARLHADVVFCPFTGSRVRDPGVPLVAAVHELHHVSHPHLLTSSQRAERARAFETIAYRAERIACATSSLRQVALGAEQVRPERVVVLPPGRLLIEAQPAQPEPLPEPLKEGASKNGFFLVAADFEPRSNHRLVLAALGILRARQPDLDIHVVCAGGLAARMAALRDLAERMGLGAFVHFRGAPRRHEMTALMNACRGVLVPSLYETIGEMVLQAMALRKPVLCSSIPALAELTGGAAVIFDPQRPEDLADALERTAGEPRLLDDVARAGHERFAALEDPASVARAYVGLFREARIACPASR